MQEEVSGESRVGLGASRAFWMRMTEILFRHPFRFLLPIVVLTGIGVALASQSVPMYQSRGVLSAAANPLVSDSEIRGTSIEAWESPAQGTSRIISEQLRTAAFTRGIAERAGLSDALASGLITLDTVRANVGASAQGNSLLTVTAQWEDPTSAYLLVTATIDSYHEFLSETVASDSNEAERYFTGLRDEADLDLQEAQLLLTTFVEGLPAVRVGEEQPIGVTIEVNSLTNRIARAEEQIATAQANIAAARLAVVQSQSEAGRSLIMVDEPSESAFPESTLMATIQSIGAFVILGGGLACVLLLVSTALDRSVSSPADLASIPGIGLTDLVPPVTSFEVASGRRGNRRTRPTSEAAVRQALNPADQAAPV